jgi:hypothetical protein
MLASEVLRVVAGPVLGQVEEQPPVVEQQEGEVLQQEPALAGVVEVQVEGMSVRELSV